MLNRIIGAFLFRKGVYEEVERDAGFTTMAWVLVIVIAFLNRLGGQLGTAAVNATAAGGDINWTAALVGIVLGTISDVIAFAIMAFAISWVGKLLFQAKTNFSEMVRVLGLAYVWNIVGLLAILGLLVPALICIVAPIAFIAWILYLLAALIGVKAALDLDWIKTIVSVVIGWIIYVVIAFLISIATGILLGMLGLAMGIV
ncbi:MAG: YIP1 family protein [Chloroflexi bacterium]|nr:YIP1 family protein [Chloroflexota bacterium]MBU1746306.1 YIP1 family protein [Chloroflexota bacterium]MBU1879854.1 YIP1 family protein [Chloroflexota bacterium]